jgi:arylsulfatase A-like enzyme
VHVSAAGLAIGLVELIRLAGHAPLPGLATTTIGLTVLLAMLVGLPLCGLGALLGRARFVQAWWAGLRAPGAPRIGALVRAVSVVVVLAGVWVVAYAVGVWSHGRFNAARAAALLTATAITVGTIALSAGAAAIAPPVGDWLGARGVLVRLTSGKVGAIALAAAAVVVVAGGVWFTRAAAPDYDWRPIYMLLGFLGLLGAAFAFDLARRVRPAGAGAITAAALLVAIGAMLQVGDDDRSRGAIAARGTTSQTMLRGLWRLSDRDGDGFASRFGGIDCDDRDRRINPRAKEVAGNGKDDNCSGGDLAAERVELRTQPVASATPDAPKRNVVLISIDAVRADHLGAWGYGRPTSPTIDALAARGARFAWAISPSPTTRRAIPAMTTGRYASTIAFKPDSWPPGMESKKHTLIAQVFQKAGYQTQAMLCCVSLFDRPSGNIEGFEGVDSTVAGLGQPHTAPYLADKAIDWLNARKDPARPFFLWMHFLDAHNPYRQPRDVPVFGSEDLDKYDAEIAFVDAHIARVIAALEATGELAETIIVITADHGDEFFEHGQRHHARSLYNEQIRIPLVVVVPGAAPRVIEEPVSLVDVGATLFDLVGVARPGGQNGRSLAAAVLGTGPAPDRTVLSELIADRQIPRNLRAPLHGSWKLVWDLDANTYELYSLADDPGDRHDRFEDEPEVAAEMRARLDEASDLELSLLPGEAPAKKRAPKKAAPKEQ